MKTLIAKNKGVWQFLKDLGLPEFDITEEVIRYIIPKYSPSLPPAPLDEHKYDIDKILQAYKTDSREKKQKLKNALQSTSFILAEFSTSNISYRKPSEIYLGSDELRIFFSGNRSVTFVNTEYPEESISLFKELGVVNSIEITCRSKPGSTDEVNLSYKGGYRRGKKGFDPDIKVEGLENALANPVIEKSKIIWNKIAVGYSHCIKGIIRLF